MLYYIEKSFFTFYRMEKKFEQKVVSIAKSSTHERILEKEKFRDINAHCS